MEAFFSALLLTVVWFFLVGMVLLYPNSKKASTTRTWQQETIFAIYILMSCAGWLGAILKSFVAIAAWLGAVVHALSLFPIFGIILYIYLNLHNVEYQALPRAYKIISFVIFCMNAILLLLLPLLLGQANDIAVALIIILFAEMVMGFKKRWLLLNLILFATIIIVSMLTKNYIRENNFSIYDYLNSHMVQQTQAVGGGTQYKLQAMQVERTKGGQQPTRSTNGIQQPTRSTNGIQQTAGPNKLYEVFSYVLDKDVYSMMHYGENYHRIRVSEQEDYKYLHYGVMRILSRIDHLTELAYVMKMTPEKVPYWNGFSYLSLVYLPIPRVLWKDKPIMTIGQNYGHRYRFITDEDHVTFWAMPINIEAWINYGWKGIIVSAILIGLLLRVLWTYCIGNRIGLGNLFLAVAVLSSTTFSESSAKIFVGNMLQMIVIFLVVEFLVRKYFNLVWLKVTKLLSPPKTIFEN